MVVLLANRTDTLNHNNVKTPEILRYGVILYINRQASSDICTEHVQPIVKAWTWEPQSYKLLITKFVFSVYVVYFRNWSNYMHMKERENMNICDTVASIFQLTSSVIHVKRLRTSDSIIERCPGNNSSDDDSREWIRKLVNYLGNLFNQHWYFLVFLSWS